ncbi:transcription initiation factor TFIID subunit 2 [Enteropsectra breve]|nr:transcription initiation factor TFIID subunit 2 [Enteropsectra breve]
MKVGVQKSIYYIDVHKKLCKGYIEVQISRSPSETTLLFHCYQILVENVHLIDENLQLKGEYLYQEDDENKTALEQHKESAENTSNSIGAQPPVVNVENGPEISAMNCTSNEKTENDKNSKSNKCNIKIKSKTKTDDEYSDVKNRFLVNLPKNFTKESFRIRLAYTPVQNNVNIFWYRPVGPSDKHREMLASSSTRYGFIAPYIDTVSEIELIYIIPNKEDLKVVSPGQLHAIKEEDEIIISEYRLTSHPKHLNFAVGTYKTVDIFNDNDARRILTPNLDVDLSIAVNDLEATIRYIEAFLKIPVLQNLNVLFTLIDTEAISSPGIVLLHLSQLPCPKDIEPAYKWKGLIAHLLATQVFGFLNFILIDYWVLHGLTGYLSDYAIKNMLGNNEFLAIYYQERKYVTENDVAEPPLFYTERVPEEYLSNRFYKTKAKLVFHCMESQLSLAFVQKICAEVVESKKYKDNENTWDYNTPRALLSFTPQLIKITKETTGQDMRHFFDFYVFSPGLLKINISLEIQRKQNMAKMLIKQQPTSLLQGCNRKAFSSFFVKSFEIDGTYEHEIFLENTDTNNAAEHVFFYHTRPKKKKKEEEEEVMPLLFIRADTKRETLFDFNIEQPDYMYMEQLSERNVIGQLEAINALVMKPTLLTSEALERILENNHTFFKVRISALFALRQINIEGYNGLQRLIQYFVRTRCIANSTVIKSNDFGLVNYFIQKALVKAISQPVANEYGDIYSSIVNGPGALSSRTQNINTLQNNENAYNDNSGAVNEKYEHSDEMFDKSENRYNINISNEESSENCPSNDLDFLNLDQYLNESLGLSKDERKNEETYITDADSNSKIVIAFLENILKFNDNMASQYDDSYYMAAVINCYSVQITNFCTKNLKEMSQYRKEKLDLCISEIERFRMLDNVFPSNNNVITRACLISMARLAYCRFIDLNKKALLSLLQYPNLHSIRILAAEMLMLNHVETFKTILKMLEHEKEDFVERILDVILSIHSYIYDGMLSGDEITYLKKNKREFLLIVNFFDRKVQRFRSRTINEEKIKPVPSILCNTFVLAENGELVPVIGRHEEKNGTLIPIYEDPSVAEETEPAPKRRKTRKVTNSMTILYGLYQRHYFNVNIKSKIEKIFEYAAALVESKEACVKMAIDTFNVIKEESNRNGILKITVNSKKVKIGKMYELKNRLTKVYGLLRISKRVTKPAPKKEMSCKVRIKVSRYVPKQLGPLIFRFKLPKNKIYAKEEIPLLLATQVKDHHNFPVIEDFIKKSKPTDFFEWDVVPVSKIFEKTRDLYKNIDNNEHINFQAELSKVLEEIEHCLIYVLSYSTFAGKIYFAAKAIYNMVEKIIYKYSHIQKTVIPMTEHIRTKCSEFINTLLAKEEYAYFYYPVDTASLKNYLDIVRVPMCLFDIKGRMVSYKSFDTFICELERISKNCLRFNSQASEIGLCAKKLREEVAVFRKEVESEGLAARETQDVLIEIIGDLEAKSHFEEMLTGIKEIKTWGDFDNELANIKKKYSRYSVNGKAVGNAIKIIKTAVMDYFPVNDGQILSL